MKSLISVRLDERLLQDMRRNADTLQVSHTEYVRQALSRMNREILRREKAKRLERASERVRKESLQINAEFGEIEHDPET